MGDNYTNLFLNVLGSDDKALKLEELVNVFTFVTQKIMELIALIMALNYHVEKIIDNRRQNDALQPGQCEIMPDMEVSLTILASAMAISLCLIWTQRRSRPSNNCCWQRPALLRPFPIIEPCRFRLLYAAFWATVVYDLVDVLVHPSQAFLNLACLEIASWLKPIIVLVNITVFAMRFFPIIAGLSTNTPIGYILATLWTWAFLILDSTLFGEEASSIKDPVDLQDFFTSNMEMSGVAISMLVLGILLPLEPLRGFVTSLRRGNQKWSSICSYHLSCNHCCSTLGDNAASRNTTEALYVREIFKKNKSCPPKSTSKVQALIDRLSLYKNVPYFRYSQTLLSTIVVGAVFLFYLILLDVYYLSAYKDALNDINGITEVFRSLVSKFTGGGTEFEDTFLQFRDLILIYFWAVYYSNLAVLCLISPFQAFLLIQLMKTYRADRLRAQRGVYKFVKTPVKSRASAIIGGAVRYMGYQSIMFAWGFIIQVVTLTVIFTLLSFLVITCIVYGIDYNWLLDRINAFWPLIALTIFIALAHAYILVPYGFTLNPWGHNLVVNNPRAYSNYAYWAFFKNIFIGLVGAMTRQIVSLIVGAAIFSRIDLPLIAPKLGVLDSGVKTYAALIHLENAYLNPSVISFINIVNEIIRSRREERHSVVQRLRLQRKSIHTVIAPGWEFVEFKETDDSFDSTIGDTLLASQQKTRRIRFKWLLYRTLLCNPELVFLRKTSKRRAFKLFLLDDQKASKSEQRPINNGAWF